MKIAPVVVAAILAAGVSACSIASPSQPGGNTVIPASRVKKALNLGPGPTTPPESAAARTACDAVHGDFARDQSWSVQPTAAYRLYECDNVPYLASDGSIYEITLRYDAQLHLIAQNTGAGVSAYQCAHAVYPQADTNPGPGIWNQQLGMCMPTAAQINNG